MTLNDVNQSKNHMRGQQSEWTSSLMLYYDNRQSVKSYTLFNLVSNR